MSFERAVRTVAAVGGGLAVASCGGAVDARNADAAPPASHEGTDGASGPEASAPEASVAANGCLQPRGTNIGIFNELVPTSPWSDPTTGLSGSLFLDPASAGSFTSGYAGMHVLYSEIEPASNQFGNDPSFGVHFSKCVDGSAFKGVTYQIWPGPGGGPAGSGGVLRVLTASTTPTPYGTCVPKSAGDCIAPYYKPGISNYGIPNQPYTITWDLLAGGSPAEPGITAATEIVGLAWVIDAWEGPPATPFQLDVFLDAVAFVPM